jgi:hypothetical protein
MSDYSKTTWVNNTTPVSATNMNKIETGIDDAHTEIDTANTAIDEYKRKIRMGAMA